MSNETLKSKQLNLGRRGFPTFALYEVTYRCNARCDYCYNDTKVKELPTKDVFTVLEKLSDSGILSLLLTGGEPFVRDDILAILQRVLELNFFRFGIMSNAVALNTNHLSFLAEHGSRISVISVSVFSGDPLVNDRILGIDGALKKALINCERLVRAGIPVIAKINLRPDNLNTYDKTVKILTDRGISVEPYPYTEMIPSCKKLFDTLDQAMRHYEDCLRVLGEDYIRNNGEKVGSSQSLCKGINTKITVNPAGYLRPCASFKDAFIGSILQDRPLNEILNESETLRHLKSLSRDDFTKCRECGYAQYCFPCPAYVYNFDKSLKCVPPIVCARTDCLMKTKQVAAI